MAEPRVFRVFISSPSDVFGERERVERVIQRLNGELSGGTVLQAIRWERNYYTADKTFQDQILLPSQTDLVVCILWKRLGFELPPEYRRPDGTTPTGTEYEFEEAMRAAKAKGTPDVLVYRKTAAVLLDAEHVDLEKAQFEALKQFWSRWFQTDAGHFTAAYQSFETTDEFERRVEQHLRQWLERNQAALANAVTWPVALKGSPFRGLQPFEESHAEVFFGRRRVVELLRERLAEAAGRGAPFLLLLGASGSGKSSVARAGLVPRLTQIGAVPGIDVWRRCTLRPSEGGGDLLLGLAQALYRADVLPELAAGDSQTPAEFAGLWAIAPEAAARAVRAALMRAGKVVAARESFDRPVEARLLLVVDQIEEALGVAEDERDKFGSALAALVDTGATWVVATLRSDLYGAFQASPPLAALRERGVQFDLLSPSPGEMSEIIVGPAQAAGLRFDGRQGGPGLDEELAEAALTPGSLPLLQFALDELFRARDPQANVLSVGAYDAFGGLSGVVERRAEATLADLDPDAAGTLPTVLSFLVNVGVDGLVTSRACLRSRAGASPAANRLLDAFVNARLLIAEDQGGEAWLRVAHEALIAGWPRAQNLIAAVRDALRVRGRVDDAAQRWAQEERHPDFLLPHGRPLAEALELAETRPDQVSSLAAAFIAASKDADDARRAAEREHAERELRLEAAAAEARAEAATRVARRTRFAVAVVSILLLLATGAAVLAMRERLEAQRQARSAQRNFTAALNGATGIVRTVNDHLRDGVMTKQAARLLLETAEANLGTLGMATPAEGLAPDLADAQSKLQSSFADVLLALGDTPGALARARDAASLADRAATEAPSDARERARSVTQNEIGDALSTEGDLQGALAAYKGAATIMEPVVARNPDNAGWARDLRVSRERIATTLRQMGDTAGALALYRSDLDANERAIAANPEDEKVLRDLAISLEHVGDMLRTRGDPAGAVKIYTRELEVAHRLADKAPGNLEWQRTLAFAEDRASSVLYAVGDIARALVHARAGLATSQALAVKDPANVEWQHDVATSQMRIGSMLAAQDDLPGSLKAFHDGLAIAQHLADLDPSNPGQQREAALFHGSIGSVLTQQGNYPAAQPELQASLASFRKAADAAPGDVGRQNDVAIAEHVVGTNLFAQGNLAGAAEHLRAGLAIAERLAAADPGSADRAVSVADFRTILGDTLSQLGDTAGALALFDADQAESVRLAAAYPQNDQWQHEIAVSQQRAGVALRRAGDMTGALARFKDALAAAESVAGKNPDKGQWQQDVIDAHNAISTMLLATDPAGSLEHASSALAKAESLMARDPTNTRWRMSVFMAHTGVGSVLKVLGRADEAKDHFAKGVAVLNAHGTAADSGATP